MQNHDVREDFTLAEDLQFAGAFTVIVSLIVGAILFAIPASCLPVAGIFLIFSGMMLVAGALMWGIGKLKSRHR